MHDLAITRQSTVLLDLPMTVRIERTLTDTFPVEYEPQSGARIGVFPRRKGGTSGSVRGKSDALWADVEPCVVLLGRKIFTLQIQFLVYTLKFYISLNF